MLPAGGVEVAAGVLGGGGVTQDQFLRVPASTGGALIIQAPSKLTRRDIQKLQALVSILSVDAGDPEPPCGDDCQPIEAEGY